jgi:hypothetical protein
VLALLNVILCGDFGATPHLKINSSIKQEHDNVAHYVHLASQLIY